MTAVRDLSALVVEDDADFLALFARELRNVGFGKEQIISLLRMDFILAVD